MRLIFLFRYYFGCCQVEHIPNKDYMKQNAQKILLSLYSLSDNGQVHNDVFKSQELRAILPGMTEGGFRSLILFMERKNWIVKDTLQSNQLLSITQQGTEALRSKFPALQSEWRQWNGKWQALIFLKASKADKQFRYLRQTLTQLHALPLSRGVYLFPRLAPPEVLHLCQTLYSDSVALFSVGEWYQGLDRPIITKYYDLAGLTNSYSSISNDINKLLVKINSKKLRTNQYKIDISTVIDRFIASLKEDPGFLQYYFPGEPDALSTLGELRKIFQL